MDVNCEKSRRVQIRKPLFCGQMVGGRGRVRTGDPLLAKQVLSQLSYTPTKETTFILKHFRLPRIAEREAAGRFLAPCTPFAMTVWAGVV